MKHLPRSNHRRGGGLALITKSTIKTSRLRSISRPSFEGFIATLARRSTSTCIVAIYRPPESSVPDFVADFNDDVTQCIAEESPNVIIVGDFNIHIDSPTNRDAIRF
jgi:hypothetical protein